MNVVSMREAKGATSFFVSISILASVGSESDLIMASNGKCLSSNILVFSLQEKLNTIIKTTTIFKEAYFLKSVIKLVSQLIFSAILYFNIFQNSY